MSDLSTDRRRPAPETGVRERNSVDLGGFVAILARHITLIAATVLVSLALALLYVLFAPLSYTSTVTILLDPRERVPIGSDQPMLPQTPDPLMVESQVKVMTSDAVLRRVVAAEGLEADPEFAPREKTPGLLDPLVKLINRGRVTSAPIDQIIDALSLSIAVRRPDRTYVVDIDMRAASPGKAARLANAVARAFLDEQRLSGEALVREQTDWAVQRSSEMRAKVQSAEQKVQTYRAEHGLVSVGGTLDHEQQLQDANRDLVAARAKAADAQSRSDQIKEIIASGHALDGTYDTINSTVIRQLRVQYSDLARRQAAASQKYGARHPEYLDVQEQLQAVKQQISSEMGRVAAALANEVRVAKANEDAAQRRVAALDTKTTDTNEVVIKLKELEREADSARVNYEKYLRASESVQRNIADSPYARILSPASMPSKPSSPKVLAALVVAMGGGLSLGIAFAVAFDRPKRRAGLRFLEPRQRPQSPQQPPESPESPPRGPAPKRPRAEQPPSPEDGRRRAWIEARRRHDFPGELGSTEPDVAAEPGAPETLSSDSPGLAASWLTPPAQPAEMPADAAGASDGPKWQEADEIAPTVEIVRPDRIEAPYAGAERVDGQQMAQAAGGTVTEIIPPPLPIATATETLRPSANAGSRLPADRPEPTDQPVAALDLTAVAAAPLDPEQTVNDLMLDLGGGAECRLLLTAEAPTALTTELALMIARRAAIEGHAVLLVDGSDSERRLTHLAEREGVPAIIAFDGVELIVTGLPGEGNGAVFVLPQRNGTEEAAEDGVERPFVDCHIKTVIVDGPAVGNDVVSFAGIANACLVIDAAGRLRRLPLHTADAYPAVA